MGGKKTSLGLGRVRDRVQWVVFHPAVTRLPSKGEADMRKELDMTPLKGQLTLRGLLIGGIGCVVLTAASAYTALKMGALPWPIVSPP